MSAGDIIPLGSSCGFCARANGERHAETCAIGSALGRARVRVAAGLAEREPTVQAVTTMQVLADCASDCEDDHAATQALMTLAEAQDAFQQMQNDEATSIALDGLETLFSVSFTETPVSRPVQALSMTALVLCQRALDNRLTEVELEREALLTYRPEAREHSHRLLELDTEVGLIRETLGELERVAAVTPGASAA